MLPYTSIPLGSVLVCSLFVAWREEGGGGEGAGEEGGLRCILMNKGSGGLWVRFGGFGGMRF